jgi:hypothetical protein
MLNPKTGKAKELRRKRHAFQGGPLYLPHSDIGHLPGSLFDAGITAARATTCFDAWRNHTECPDDPVLRA